MNRIGTRLTHSVAVLSMVAAGTMSTAQAHSTDTGQSRAQIYAAQASQAGLNAEQAHQLQTSVDDKLDEMKIDAHQVSANEIVADDGSLKMTAPLPGTGKPRPLSEPGAQAGCPDGEICLYAGDHYDHWMTNLYYCGYYDLGKSGKGDRLTSYDNRQTKGTRAKFYNWTSNGRDYLFDSRAPHKEGDLAGTGWNNKVDWVKPC